MLSPEYAAWMAYVPGAKDDDVKEAAVEYSEPVPEVTALPVPSTTPVLRSVKVIVPVGIVKLATVKISCAVTVKPWPTVEGFADELSVTLVGASLSNTVTSSVCDTPGK